MTDEGAGRDGRCVCVGVCAGGGRGAFQAGSARKQDGAGRRRGASSRGKRSFRCLGKRGASPPREVPATSPRAAGGPGGQSGGSEASGVCVRVPAGGVGERASNAEWRERKKKRRAPVPPHFVFVFSLRQTPSLRPPSRASSPAHGLLALHVRRPGTHTHTHVNSPPARLAPLVTKCRPASCASPRKTRWRKGWPACWRAGPCGARRRGEFQEGGELPLWGAGGPAEGRRGGGRTGGRGGEGPRPPPPPLRSDLSTRPLLTYPPPPCHAAPNTAGPTASPPPSLPWAPATSPSPAWRAT